MKVRLTRAAEVDVAGVLAWYSERDAELGERFFRAIESCLGSIEEKPHAFAKVHGDIRRALLRRFPYCVYYIVSGREVVV